MNNQKKINLNFKSLSMTEKGRYMELMGYSNNKNKPIKYEYDNGKIITLKKNQLVKSYSEISQIFMIGRPACKKFMDKLCDLNLIEINQISYSRGNINLITFLFVGYGSVNSSVNSQRSMQEEVMTWSVNSSVNSELFSSVKSDYFCDEVYSQLIDYLDGTYDAVNACETVKILKKFEGLLVNSQRIEPKRFTTWSVNEIYYIVIIYIIHFVHNIYLSQTSCDLSYENLEINLPHEKRGKISSHKVTNEDVEKVYLEYPSTCPVTGKRNGKSKKNKEKIRTLIKSGTYNADELVEIIKLYTQEVKNENFKQMKNFTTFLNNIPDYTDEDFKKLNSLKEWDEITSCGQLDCFDDKTVLRVTKIPTQKEIDMTGSSERTDVRDYVNSIRSKIKSGWATYIFHEVIT